MKVHYRTEYNTTKVAADTTRKATAIAERLDTSPIFGVDLTSPGLVSLDQLAAIHDREYLTALRTGRPGSLAASNGLGWDADLLTAVRASTGGVCDAVLDALANRVNSGSLSSGLHHATASHGAGYCTLNGLVVGALAGRGAGADRVLIVDFDAHCGGGTASLIDGLDGIEQIDVSVSSFDRYTSRPDARLAMSDGHDYLGDLERMLDSVATPTNIDVVIYNAGMDPHRAAGGIGPIGTDTLRDRERLVFGWAAAHGLPVAWVLAGGYTVSISMDELVDLHLLTVHAALAPATA